MGECGWKLGCQPGSKHWAWWERKLEVWRGLPLGHLFANIPVHPHVAGPVPNAGRTAGDK